jgi:predicted AAA+ superfamily ATPase
VARNVSTEASVTTLARDVPDAGRPLDRETVASYLDALERLMIVEDLPAWQTALRDSATLRKSAKRHFVDPSLAAAASLKAAVAAIDTQIVGPPDALCVITGTGPGYRRNDGVAVVPIGALAP